MNVQLYKTALDKIKASDKTKESIMNIPEKCTSARRSKPWGAILPIAAALVMMLGTAAYAASNGIFSVILGKEADYSDFEGLTGDMEISSLESTLDGLTVTPVGYAADSYNIFCVFRLEFDNELPEYDAYEEQYIDGWGHDGVKMTEIYEKFSDIGGSTNIRFEREDSKNFYCVFTVNCYGEMSGEIPLEFTCFNISGVYLNESNIISHKQLTDGNLFSASFTVDIPEFDSVSAGTDGLSFTISSCGVAVDTEGYSYDSLMNRKTGLLSGEAYVKLKNGETIKCVSAYSKIYAFVEDCFGGWFTPLEGHFHAGFEYPVDPDEVEYLYAGGIEYPIKSHE